MERLKRRPAAKDAFIARSRPRFPLLSSSRCFSAAQPGTVTAFQGIPSADGPCGSVAIEFGTRSEGEKV